MPRYGKGIPLLKPSMLKTGWTFRWLWNSVGFGRYYFFFLPFGSFRLPQTRVCTTTCTSINNCHNNKSKEDFDGDEMKDERINYLPKKAELQICDHMCAVRGQSGSLSPSKPSLDILFSGTPDGTTFLAFSFLRREHGAPIDHLPSMHRSDSPQLTLADILEVRSATSGVLTVFDVHAGLCISFFLLRQRQWNGWSNLAAGQIHDLGQRAYSSSMINDLIQRATAGTMARTHWGGGLDEAEQTPKSLCALISAWQRSRGSVCRVIFPKTARTPKEAANPDVMLSSGCSFVML